LWWRHGISSEIIKKALCAIIAAAYQARRMKSAKWRGGGGASKISYQKRKSEISARTISRRKINRVSNIIGEIIKRSIAIAAA